MRARHSRSVIDALADKRRELGGDGFAAYAFLTLSLLAFQSPEVVEFILKQADEAVA